MGSRFIAAATLLAAASLAVAADGVIYTCVDAKGHRTYTNAPCPSGSEAKGAKVYDDPGWNPQAAAKVEADRQAVEARRTAASADYSLGRPASRWEACYVAVSAAQGQEQRRLPIFRIMHIM